MVSTRREVKHLMGRYVRLGKWEVHVALIALSLLVMMLGSAIAILYFTKTTTHQATIETVGTIELYSDSACSIVFNGRDWGTYVVAGEIKNFNVWLKNIGNTQVKVRWMCTVLTTLYNEDALRNTSWYSAVTSTKPCDGGATAWRPKISTSAPLNNIVTLAKGEVDALTLHLANFANQAPDTLTFTWFFEASDT